MTLWQYIVIIAGAIVVILLAILCYLFIIRPNKLKKALKELERKYSYLDALLIGQDSQYIHRLESISRTNLLYVEKHQTFSKRFKDVFEGDDKAAESSIKQLKALIANKQYKHIKNVLNETRTNMKVFENNVSTLDQDLFAVIKQEEEARQSILRLKEKYRSIKQAYFANQSDLELVSNSFSTIFSKLDAYFVDFENNIESGEYEEANALIETIDKVTSSLERALAELPSLCLQACSIIPGKIGDIEDEYVSIEKNGLPLFNLSFKSRVDRWNIRLEEVKKRLVAFKLSGLEEELNDIESEITETYDRLHDEVDDKNDFDNSSDSIYGKVVALEKSFVKICSILPEIRKVYLVSAEKEEKIESLSKSINSLGNTKRTLDNFVHSATRQPYSILKEKLDKLSEDYDVAYQEVEDFKLYLDTLRKTSENAHSMIFAYYYRCKEVEKTIRDMNVPSFAESQKFQIQSCYDIISELDSLLKKQPIDVEKVDTLSENLKDIANKYFDDVENAFREMQLAESTIVYANRDRIHQSNVHQQFLQLENMFYKGEFSKVYHEGSALFQRTHVEENAENNQ